MSLEEFTPEAIGKSSSACKSLCAWVRELYKYHTLGQALADSELQDYASKSATELLTEFQAAVQELPKAALQEMKSLAKPPKEVALICSCLLHLFAGIAPEIELTRTGNAKDASWGACQKLLSNPVAILQRLHDFQNIVDAGMVPAKNIKRVRKMLSEMGHFLNPEIMGAKSVAAAHLCRWLIAAIAYCKHAGPIQNQPQVNQAPNVVKETASEACKYLAKADIVEIKSLAAPPQPVVIVCACLCTLLGRQENSGWAGAKAMLSDPSILKTLQEYKKEDVTAEQVFQVRQLLNQGAEFMDGDKMKSVSRAAYGLLQWVLAMIEVE